MLEQLWANFVDKLDLPFLLLGLPAQIAFYMRFIVQWIVSERKGRSVVPVSFWYLSLVGGIGLFAYFTFFRAEPLGVIGQLPAAFVYVRNLMLLKKEKRENAAAEARQTPAPDPEGDGVVPMDACDAAEDLPDGQRDGRASSSVAASSSATGE